MKELIPVVAGFLLTTVLGGVLGFFFQRRSWAHQHAVQLMEQERERAVRIFEEISRLMDKRLYRLRLLYWGLAPENPDEKRSALSESRMEDYRHVLYEWNDSINRNLALVQQYFGDKMRHQLDYAIGASFVGLGRKVEALWKSDVSSRAQRRSNDVDRQLKELGSLVYGFNLKMIRAIQSGSVGWLVTQNRRQPSVNRNSEAEA